MGVKRALISGFDIIAEFHHLDFMEEDAFFFYLAGLHMDPEVEEAANLEVEYQKWCHSPCQEVR